MKFSYNEDMDCSEIGITSAPAIILSDDAAYLQERILVLELEKIDLQRLVCELLKKNEELRMRRREPVGEATSR